MKITQVIGNTFVNTVPAKVGQTVFVTDMIDARQGEVVLDNGFVFEGLCSRLVDQGFAKDGTQAVEEVVTSIPSPAVQEPESTVEVAEEKVVKKPVVKS
jgi:hypothetical protein